MSGRGGYHNARNFGDTLSILAAEEKYAFLRIRKLRISEKAIYNLLGYDYSFSGQNDALSTGLRHTYKVGDYSLSVKPFRAVSFRVKLHAEERKLRVLHGADLATPAFRQSMEISRQ